MKNKNFYLYVYLDPRKPGIFVYEDLKFNFEPIYIGKGKNERYKYHIIKAFDENIISLKFNKLRSIIKTTSITKNDYINKFIIKVYENENEEFILLKEKEYVEKIGTIQEVFGVNKRGPLTNLLRGGIANPILLGENNPMYNKSIFYIWKSKYNEIEVENRKKQWKKLIGNKTKKTWKNYSKEKLDDIKQKISIKMSGDNHFTKKMSIDDYKKYIHKRVSTWKKTYTTRTVEKQNEINDKHSKSLKKYWDNISEDKLELFRNSVKQSLEFYFENVYSEQDRKKRSENSKISWKKLKSNTDKYNKFIQSISGSNHYLSNFSSKYDYYEEKYGIEYVNKMKLETKERLSGKNNPMYGKGHKVSGANNGRAVIYIVHFPNDKKYLCIGTFKKLCKEILINIKPQPHRKYNHDGNTYNGWLFKKLKSINEINLEDYEIFE